jgi:pyruvate-formate lyase
VYEASESLRAEYFPTPYLSCLVRGCAEKGRDVTRGGAEINFTTLEAVTYATTVDSLLAIKYLVFDRKKCTMGELMDALKNNWQGHGVLQAFAKNKAPKYGRDDDEADAHGETGHGSVVQRGLETPNRFNGASVQARHAQLELLGG